MQRIFLFLLAFTVSYCSLAQHTVALRNLWQKPQVHVQFNDYTISFSIKDINRSLQLLSGLGDFTYGTTSGLDTALDYPMELYMGKMQYKTRLQELLHNEVAAFLLTAGHAEVRNKKQKLLKEINVEVTIPSIGEDATVVTAYDPKNNKMIFWGTMKADMYHQDLGID